MLMPRRHLLDSAATIQDEVQRYLCEGKDVDGCITSATVWESNRERLRELLSSFGTKQEFVVRFLSSCGLL